MLFLLAFALGCSLFVEAVPDHYGYLRSSVPEVERMRDSAPVVEVRAGSPPQSVDWTGKATTAPKNQGSCGACWAFSATEQVESALAMATGNLQELSVEQILVCCGSNISTCSGCMGGDTIVAYKYLIERSRGLDGAADYPYDEHTDPFDPPKCKAQDYPAKVQVTNWSYAVPGCRHGDCPPDKSKEERLAAVVAEKGPVSICINAASSFRPYSGGIYDGPCSSKVEDLNHCVQIVGYDLQEGYWKVRNSWSTDWGEAGYIRMAFGQNLCGIANEATIVTVVAR
eukprot:g2080.t1